MKKSILLAMTTVALATFSCSNESEFKMGEGGLEYNYIKEGSKEKAVIGDAIVFNLIVKNDKDSVISSSFTNGIPHIQTVVDNASIKNGYPGDSNSILGMLGEGDSAIFRLNLDTMVAHTQQPKPPFADKYLEFTFKVEKILKKTGLTDSAYYDQLNKLQQEVIEKAQKNK